jgi:hypothetical protein
VASVRDKGFDGTFIDCMGSGFDWWACNIEHGTPYEIDADGDGKPDDRAWLNETWRKAKTDLARKVREAVGAKAVFMTNGAGEWGIPYMNGILLEDRLDYVLDGRGRWEDVVREYLRWTEAPSKPNVTTIVSSSGIEPPYEGWKRMDAKERKALLERGRNLKDRMRFGLATTLMGDGYYAYDLHTRWRGQRWWYPEYDAPLGYPKGKGRQEADGTWRREFDGGTVIVNPTPFDAEVAFAGRHRDVTTEKVDDHFVIPAMDGRILLPTDAEVASGAIPDPQPLFKPFGPEAVVARGDRVLFRLKDAAALFDVSGRLLMLTDGGRVLLEGLAAFIVRTPWRDFGYADCRCLMLPDGRVQFTGRRTDGDFAVGYQQEALVENRALSVTYRWEALTDAQFHMFRQQADFPMGQYQGGRFKTDAGETALPHDQAAQPRLGGPLRRITMIPTDGPRVTIEVTTDAALVDERHYGVQAYRLGASPAPRDVKAGQKWECSFRIQVE